MSLSRVVPLPNCFKWRFATGYQPLNWDDPPSIVIPFIYSTPLKNFHRKVLVGTWNVFFGGGGYPVPTPAARIPTASIIRRGHMPLFPNEMGIPIQQPSGWIDHAQTSQQRGVNNHSTVRHGNPQWVKSDDWFLQLPGSENSWKSSILTRVNWSLIEYQSGNKNQLDFCGYLCRASVHKLLETKKLLFTHLTAPADNELFDSHGKSWHVYTLVTSAKYAWIELTNMQTLFNNMA